MSRSASRVCGWSGPATWSSSRSTSRVAHRRIRRVGQLSRRSHSVIELAVFEQFNMTGGERIIMIANNGKGLLAEETGDGVSAFHDEPVEPAIE